MYLIISGVRKCKKLEEVIPGCETACTIINGCVAEF